MSYKRMTRADFAEAGDVHIDRALTIYSQQLKNEMFIAPEAMPLVRVQKRSDKYFVYDRAQRFSLPKTLIDPKSRPDELSLKLSQDNYSVSDYGLMDFVDREQMKNADQPLDPARDALELLQEILMLDWEKRVADIVHGASTYAASNKLTPANKWSDTVSGNPLKDMLDSLDVPLMRPNIAIFGAESWRTFRQHPKILDAVKGATRSQTAGGGVASREDVAALFELDAVFVGRARINLEAAGAAEDLTSRLWGDNVALLHRRKNIGPRTITFGCTFQSVPLQVQRIPENIRGVTGGEIVKVTMNGDEKVKAADLGFLISDVTA